MHYDTGPGDQLECVAMPGKQSAHHFGCLGRIGMYAGTELSNQIIRSEI